MLLLLPPSETKRDGGAVGSSLQLAELSFPDLTRSRRAALAGLRVISKSVAASTVALRLGPTQRFEVDRNRAVSSSPTLSAIERYTGVLYDAIDITNLDPAARRFLGEHLIIHSALFGMIGADDLIPAYRFSHDSRIPGSSLAKIWRADNAAVLSRQRGLVLDLRSESYVHLGPAGDGSYFLRVVTEDGAGTKRALNHFNKHGKGELVRLLAAAGHDFTSIDELLEWARAAGVQLERGAPGEVDLVV
ncbi:MAG TPA: peroxide stress protein YaaA [Galbitalea sp.]|nr:peroxide stress protein YaaA [Galbitalea sp.]